MDIEYILDGDARKHDIVDNSSEPPMRPKRNFIVQLIIKPRIGRNLVASSEC